MSAPRKPAKPKPPKGEPTDLNRWVLLDLLEGKRRDQAPGGVITQVDAPSVPHVRRMIAAGWLEPAPGVRNGWRLSDYGSERIAETREAELRKNRRAAKASIEHAQARSIFRSLMRGGAADGMHPRDFDTEALTRGTEHELEHTISLDLAMEIAMDHLAENPSYYDRAANTRPIPNSGPARAVELHPEGPGTIGHPTQPAGFEVTTHFGKRYFVSGSEIGHSARRPLAKDAITSRLVERIPDASSWRARPGYYTSAARKLEIRELVAPTERRRSDDAWVGPFSHLGDVKAYWQRHPIDNPARAPFLQLDEHAQRRVIDRCLGEHGSRSCIGSLMLLENSSTGKQRARVARLRLYAKQAARRSRPIPNPSPTDWTAIPILIVPVDIRGARLTHTQVLELDELDL